MAGAPPPSPPLLRAGQPQFSALWQRGWREQLAPCGPLRRGDSPVGDRPLEQWRPWKSGLRAEAGAARGELGSSGRQVGVEDSAGARRDRAGSEAVRGCDGLEVEWFVSAVRPGKARASRSGKFAATAAVLGGLCGNQGGKEEGGTVAGRRRPAPGSPGELGVGGRAGRPGVRVQERGRASRLPSGVTQCSPSVVSAAAPSHRRRSREWGVAACPRVPLEDATARALEPW